MRSDNELISATSFLKATEQGRRLSTRSPLAIKARYVAKRMHVELDNGCAFEFPISQTQGLSGADVSDLRQVEISAAGLGLYWPTLDVDLYVPNLIKGVLGTKQWMAHIGSTGGKRKSTAKSIAARVNGKLGGRPKKIQANTLA